MNRVTKEELFILDDFIHNDNTQYCYDWQGFDYETILPLIDKLMKENERSNEYIDFYKGLNEKAVKSVKYYVDILTDLKKWLEEGKAKPQYLASNYYYDSCVLEKIKELEDKHNA